MRSRPLSPLRWTFVLLTVHGLLQLISPPLVAQTSAPQASATRPSRAAVEGILRAYCYDCHGGGAEEGGLSLERLVETANLAEGHGKWLAVWKNLRAQTMPPSDQQQPSLDDRQALLRWIEHDVFRLDPARPDPGRVTIRRMNRQEYHFSILDLFGIDFDATEAFPADDTGYGFDTIGDVLSLSPLHLEKYLSAAQTIVSQLDLVPQKLPGGGEEGQAVGVRNAERTERKSGKQREYSAAYRRIFFDGPPPGDAAGRDAYRRAILERCALRIFRRPTDEATIGKLEAIATLSAGPMPVTFEQGIGQALVAMLSSPRFLFRAETQPRPDDPQRVVPLDEYALASRLSFFLWSSTPDDELLRLAQEGQLRSDLDSQVDRMLADPRSERLVRSFVGQWLQTRDVETKNVDARRILRLPSNSDANRVFNRNLRRAMREETELLFGHILKENRSAQELLTADYTFVNEALARWYGLDEVQGSHMRKVALPPDAHRGGILTQASVLMVTSNPIRTSPVKRGLFILENVLGTPAAPPPGDVPALEEAGKGTFRKLTVRELLEIHRRDALCASCHARMDPIGLALEEYNAIGQWRAEEQGKPIETSGQLITGEKFTDVRDLARVIIDQRRHDFYRCLAEKMLTFAIGRGIEYYDAPAIDRMVRDLDADQGKLRTLVRGIVNSAPFQLRRGDGRHATRRTGG